MSYKLTFTPNFEKHYNRFPLSLKKKVQNKLLLLADDPSYPSLRTKRIKGTADLWESSVNMDVRIIWKYFDGSIILTLDIGHHDILNKF